MFNVKDSQQNILVLSFYPSDEDEMALIPVLDYLGWQDVEETLKFRDFPSRYKIYDLFAQMYQGRISISSETPFVSLAAHKIDHARTVGDPMVVIDYHPDDGTQSVITVLMPYGMGYVNTSIIVAAKSLGGHGSYAIARSAIQAMEHQKDNLHKWSKELNIPVVYYFKDNLGEVAFGYSRGCYKPGLATIYGNQYIRNHSSVLSEIEDIQAIHSSPVPQGSIGEDTFHDYLFSTVSDASENNEQVMIIVETTEDDSALYDLGLLDVYLISEDRTSNKKFPIADLERMDAISAASHVMKTLESK